MNEQLSRRAKEIIAQIKYATIATVSKDGLPWNAPVFCAYDESLNFYWGSHTGSQHSRNIADTGRAFLVFYDSTVPPGQGAGVYVQARVAELNEPHEIELAYRLLVERRRPVPYWKFEQVQGDVPIRLYKAIPEKLWINDESEADGNYIDVRTEVDPKRF